MRNSGFGEGPVRCRRHADVRWLGSAAPPPEPWSRDAWLVERLRLAGAVLIGKTHTVEFAYGGVGFNAHWGEVGGTGLGMLACFSAGVAITNGSPHSDELFRYLENTVYPIYVLNGRPAIGFGMIALQQAEIALKLQVHPAQCLCALGLCVWKEICERDLACAHDNVTNQEWTDQFKENHRRHDDLA